MKYRQHNGANSAFPRMNYTHTETPHIKFPPSEDALNPGPGKDEYFRNNNGEDLRRPGFGGRGRMKIGKTPRKRGDEKFGWWNRMKLISFVVKRRCDQQNVIVAVYKIF